MRSIKLPNGWRQFSSRVPFNATLRSFIFWKTRLRRDAATNARDAHAILHGLLGLRFGQWQGSLAKDVSPACRSANISVAKPEFVIGWFTSLHRLDPKESSHDCGVAPHFDFLCS